MSQSYTCLCYHVIFATKGREPSITAEVQKRLYDYIGGIIKGENGYLLAVGGVADHVHLLIVLHPQSSVAEVMRLVKANSSKWVHETFPGKNRFTWQVGYGAFTVSFSNIDQVKQYIADQERHHRGATFDEEFVIFLERHKVQYDPRYL